MNSDEDDLRPYYDLSTLRPVPPDKVHFRKRVKVRRPPDRNYTVSQPCTPVHGHELDPNWVYTDKAGHEHRPVDGKYPSLQTQTEFVPCDDPECCDGYDAEYTECVQCGERISIGTRPATFYQTGYASYLIDGVPVTQGEYEQSLKGYLEWAEKWKAHVATLSGEELAEVQREEALRSGQRSNAQRGPEDQRGAV